MRQDEPQVDEIHGAGFADVVLNHVGHARFRRRHPCQMALSHLDGDRIAIDGHDRSTIGHQLGTVSPADFAIAASEIQDPCSRPDSGLREKRFRREPCGVRQDHQTVRSSFPTRYDVGVVRQRQSPIQSQLPQMNPVLLLHNNSADSGWTRPPSPPEPPSPRTVPRQFPRTAP